MKVMLFRYLDGFVERISAVGNWLACIALILISVGVTVNAFSRFLFAQPLVFVDEYSQYLLVAIFYFGVGYTLRAGKHVSVRMLIDRLEGLSRTLLQTAVSLLSMGVIGIMTWYGWQSFLSTYRMGMVSLTPLETPLAIPFLFMSLGMSVFFLESLVVVLRNIGVLFGMPQEERVESEIQI